MRNLHNVFDTEMKRRCVMCKTISIFLSAVMLCIVLGVSDQANAGVSVGIGYGGWEYHHDRFAVRGYFPLRDYYSDTYYSPYYYTVPAYAYVAPAQPLGSVVYAIPFGCQLVNINGVTYYENNGTYYLPIAGGYQIVVPPALTASVPVVVPQGQTAEAQQEFTVNVPNAQGAYTAVVIRRSGTGFVGPQGEFYPEFPKVDQLQLMYTK